MTSINITKFLLQLVIHKQILFITVHYHNHVYDYLIRNPRIKCYQYSRPLFLLVIHCIFGCMHVAPANFTYRQCLSSVLLNKCQKQSIDNLNQSLTSKSTLECPYIELHSETGTSIDHDIIFKYCKCNTRFLICHIFKQILQDTQNLASLYRKMNI